MTRRRFILTAVLLVCVAAVVVPHWRELCLAVGYERKSWDFPIHDYLKKRAL